MDQESTLTWNKRLDKLAFLIETRKSILALADQTCHSTYISGSEYRAQVHEVIKTIENDIREEIGVPVSNLGSVIDFVMKQAEVVENPGLYNLICALNRDFTKRQLDELEAYIEEIKNDQG